MVWLRNKTEKTSGRSSIARGFVAALAVYACLGFGITASAQDIGTYAFVDARALNLRASPNTEASVIRTLPRRTVVSILERKGDWARVFVQDSNGGAAEGWLSTQFLGRPADTSAGLRSRLDERSAAGHYPSYNRAGPLRISKLDFDCRRPLFGNSGIRKCGVSVRVQLSPEEYDPNRSDSVLIACRGAISYRTENDRHAQRIVAVERQSIARNDRLGRTVRVNFDVHSNRNKIVSAQLRAFSCARD
ncbi:SH3 domain-containing protein [Martelella mediterranea]|uniref:SH3 domain-containing protein n=1 Tax=Martelella mediterranea TaxID=293089 RepID=A0A4R3P049_9HYPH|nr:SH3 domain-containing protein [Martelella mediterranea]TCT41851.1 SH3 domain-containing protein [Martelella mediterranea]